MSELSYLEKLLDGFEVKWMPLAEVCRFINGRAYKQEELLSEGKYPVLRVGNFFTNQSWYYSGLELDQDKYCDKGDLLYAWSASFGPRIWDGDKSIYHYHIWKVVPDSNLICQQFLYYLLQWDTKALKDVHSTGSTMLHISKAAIEKRLVPIPCPDNPKKSLAIQSEIVRILDTFTALTAELTAELNMRKKQYNYYRDQLLSFKEGEVEWKTLGDVTKKWYSGGTPTAGKAEYYENGSIPWLRTQEVKFSDINSTEIKITQAALKNSAAKWIPENCVIIAISGATAGRSAINKIPLTTNQHCGCLEIDDTKALYRYVFHWVSFNYENIKSLGQGARGDLNSTIIKNFKLPIPYATDPDKSLEEQARIVEILDKFDTLTHSINEGLPREIELRQKQYEYYRDMLFSFPKPEVAEA
ncbi:restriction endonuclease subunit S [Nissabacter archeti]|uniref:restriction endonuclease subunit S n=1 Tax=Nissabacter archeti TaxID=1917880 RepID=UPI0009331906|nr:restriction endonuclease subunit S [Nissabacter archeti]